MRFEDIYRDCKQDVFVYLCSLTGSVSEAEELTAETFFRAYMGFPSYRGEANLKTWLFAIAKHAFFDSLRRSGRSVPTEDTLLYQLRAQTEWVGDTAEETELAALVDALLHQKDERSRRVFRLRMDGWSFREIGKAVGLSESSARVIEHRVRMFLREELRKEGYGYD